jgi:hypothetical protein
VSELALNLNVISQALALLTGDNQQPNIQALLTSYLTLAQEFETALYALYESRIIANAVGAQLNILGNIVGAQRGNLDDADYRTAIKIQIAVNSSQGRASDLVNIGVLAGVSPVYVQGAPACFQITVIDGILPIAQALTNAKALGTAGEMISYPAGEKALMWDTVAGGLVPVGWDDVADSLAIGRWCEVTEI